MSELRQSDLTRILAFLSDGENVTEPEGFPSYVLAGLPGIVPCDIVAYNWVDSDSGTVHAVAEPGESRFGGDEQVLGALMSQHPLITRYLATRDGRAFKISDLISRDEFHALELYQQLYRPMRVEYQMAFCLPAPHPTWIGIALSRERRDFSERDRGILNLLRPHLEELHRRLATTWRVGRSVDALLTVADAAGQGVVVLDGAHASFLTPHASMLLADFFPTDQESRGALPTAVLAWLDRQKSGFTGSFETPPPSEVLDVSREDSRLVVRYLPALRPDDSDLLVLEQPDSQGAAADSPMTIGLTRRESEILALVADGKTNSDIGADLFLSPRTVQKHLEHIYRKLGVPNRAAAVARAGVATFHPGGHFTSPASDGLKVGGLSS